jgi:hypothetical protein
MASLPELREIPNSEIDSTNYVLEISISNSSHFTYVFGGFIRTQLNISQSSLQNKSIAQILQQNTTKGIKIVIKNDITISDLNIISLQNPVTNNNRFYLTTDNNTTIKLYLNGARNQPLFASLKDSIIENIDFINIGIPISYNIENSNIKKCSLNNLTVIKSSIVYLFGTVSNTEFNQITINNNTTYTLFGSITSSKILNSTFIDINLTDKHFLSDTLDNCTIISNTFNSVNNAFANTIKNNSLIESNTFTNCTINDPTKLYVLCNNMFETILNKNSFTTININQQLILNTNDIGIIKDVTNSKIIECGFNNINITSAKYGGTVFGTGYMTTITKCNFDNININVNPNFNYRYSVVGCIGGKIYNCIINNNILKKNITIRKYPDYSLSGLIIGELSERAPLTITTPEDLDKNKYNITCNYINNTVYNAYTINGNNLFQRQASFTNNQFILANIYVMLNDIELSSIEYESTAITCLNAPIKQTTSSTSQPTSSTSQPTSSNSQPTSTTILYDIQTKSSISPSLQNNNLMIILIIIGSILGIGGVLIYYKLFKNRI